MVRRASKKKKDRPTREVRKVILVSAEGMNKTERTYLAEFNRLQKDYHIVFATGTSTDSVNIVSEAIDGVTKNGLNLRQGDIACAVFDADFGKAGKIKEARQIAKKAGIRVILSNPCFEVWLLQHFRYSTRGYLSNDAVIDDLLGYWPEYRKSIGSYQAIVDKTWKCYMSEPIVQIDLHGMFQDEAIKVIDKALMSADSSTYQIKLIHGYNRGISLKSMIVDEYKYHPKVLRIQPGDNLGTTILVLREL